MAVNAKRVGLYGAVGFLVAALIIVGVVISSITIRSLRPPTFAPNTGTLVIKLTDAPVDLDRLNITIDSVSIHRVKGDAWVDLPFVPPEPDAPTPTEVSFNLLALDDVKMDLCVADVPAGNYTMIKMHIKAPATAYYKTALTTPVELKVPSESVKVILQFGVKKEQVTTILIDMEADWVAISQRRVLRPVLKATVL